MKLQSKRARLPIAALGVTALIAGAGALASPAFAIGETLTFLGADANAATIVAVDPTASTNNAGLSFGVKIGGAPSSDPRDLVLEVLTGPTSGAVYAERVVGNAVPAANAAGAQAAGAGPTPVTTTNTAGATSLTLNIASTADLTGHTISVGSDLATVVSGGSTTTLVLDRPIVAAHVGATAVMDLGATSVPAFLPTGVGTTDKLFSYASTGVDNIYLGATTAGTYTFRLFKDAGSDGAYQANADDTTPTFTLTVKSAADALTLSAPATVDEGTQGSKATVVSTLTATDVRGGSPATLATNIAARLNVALTDNGAGNTGVTGDAAGGPITYDATNGFYRYLGTTSTTALLQGGTTPHTVSTALTFNGGGVLSTKVTEVTTNGVTALALAAKSGQDADVSGTGVNIKIRTGVGKVTYSATATAGGIAQAGKTVTFVLTPGSGTTLADLSVNGTPVATTGPTAGQATANTDAAGVASIDVTSAKTANGNIYSIAASSGSGSATTTSTYETAVATTVTITSTVAELTPAVTTTPVPVKGQLMDQYGVKFQPPSSDTQQVVVSGGATGNAVVTDGVFTYNYVPVTTPVAGTTTSLTFTYNGGPSASATIQWASTTPAASITLITPANGAKAVTLQDNTTPVPAQGNTGTPAFGNTTGAVTGTVLDSTNATLAFKSVTLTGSDGVYFSSSATPDATHKLEKTLDVVTNNSGAITGAWVYFTKSGPAKVTATTGSVHADSEVTTEEPAAGQKYHLNVNDTTASPGQTVIVTGKVDDIFGNSVPSATVTLSTGASTVGALGDTSVTTNSEGIFSTTFLAGSNGSGVVDLTATLTGQVANEVPVAAYATAGITLTDGNYTDVGKITVTSVKLTLVASPKLTAKYNGVSAKLTGTAMPNSSVLIYAKPSGAVSYQLIDTAEADADGDWGASEQIVKSTYFLARSGDGMSSKSDLTLVNSSIAKITAKAKGTGMASVYVNGDPNAKGTLTVYRSVAGPDIKLKTVTTSSYGSATVTVKLPRGTRTVYAKYKAPGTYTATSVKVKVRVK